MRNLRTRSRFLVTIVASLALAGCAIPDGGARVDGGHLVDSQQRWLSVRGVAVTGLVQYARDYAENPPITSADLREIAALGFNEIRLPISWSRLEPHRGVFDAAYLRRIAWVVRTAGVDGLNVVVDGHFDRYNRSLVPGDEADGAPDWATVEPGAPTPAACVARFGSFHCVQNAWQSFWTDAQGVQRAYVRAMVRVSQTLQGAPNVLGIELMNNPSTGFTPSPAFERTELFPFYRRAVTALRSAGERQPVLLDENAASEQTGGYTGPDVRAPAGGGLVLAAHDYAGVFSGAPWPAGGTGRLGDWIAGLVHTAGTLGLTPMIGEWGIGPGRGNDAWIAADLELQNTARIGSTFWMWKQRPGFYGWPVVGLDGALRTDTMRAQLLGTPHPDATPGVLEAASYAPGGALTVRVSTRAAGTAVLWSGAVVRSGGQTLLPQPLIHAAVDGVATTARLRLRAFRNASVALGGYLVSVRVPPGTHTITLR